MSPNAVSTNSLPPGEAIVPIQRITAWIRQFLGVLHQADYYPAGHPAVVKALDGVMAGLGEILAQNGALHLTIVGDQVLLEDYPRGDNEVRLQGLLKELHSKKVEHISFVPGVERQEIASLFSLLRRQDSGDSAEDLSTALEEAGIHHIHIGRLATGDQEETAEGRVAKKIYNDAVIAIEEIYNLIGSENRLSMNRAKEIVEAVVDDHHRGGQLQALTWLKSHDDYTYTHVLNVCILTVAQARTLGIPDHHVHNIGLAALLHDTGKCFIPAELIRKPGKLTPEEFDIIRSHPSLGAKLLRKLPNVDDLTVLVAYEHHIRFDGGGYPEQAHRRVPNLASRLCTLADYYDALRTIRSYKEEITPDEALRIMGRGAGTILDPELFKHFANMIGPYPRGCLVELTDGSVGAVVQTNSGFVDQPILQLIHDKEGGSLVDLPLLDLRREEGKDSPLMISRAIDPNKSEVNVEDYL